MAKKAAKAKAKSATGSAKRTTGSSAGASRAKRKAGGTADAKNKHLVIVESPTKAKTINKYLGKDYVVMASVGHVRDLPSRNPKGVTAPVPGVDLENDFKPTYEILSGKKKTITELKRAARQAADVWFATDFDREGEAIAWHLAHALGINIDSAKRVVFNAITKGEIENAFAHPHKIDQSRVDAQQARRILDRIVGYQVSPLLWKKVAGGLSAGRVQSVAVRLVVEREEEIDAFIPDEYWKIPACFTSDVQRVDALRKQWSEWLAQQEAVPQPGGNGRAKGPTLRQKLDWLGAHQSFPAELVEVDGQTVQLTNADQALAMAEAAGFQLVQRDESEDPKGKGPAAHRVRLVGVIQDGGIRWSVESVKTKRTTSKPPAPFITSTLQQAAANQLGFAATTTMRLAQQLYEGVEVKSLGSVGLITYMRTDSTHLSDEALKMVREYIDATYGAKYVPQKANLYSSSNKAAQEAHEAIRPTDVTLGPDDPRIRKALNDQQLKLYRLIWTRFVACQMTPAEWDATTLMLAGTSSRHRVLFKANGRVLVFDGFYRVQGRPAADDPILPALQEGQAVAPIDLQATQHFTNPPARYTEASLVKKLESEGIGRPSTYASIIQVIQNRKYVEKISGRFHATDLGTVVTQKLVEGFPGIMDVGYTRCMEENLDKIEEEHTDWVKMLRDFYGPFKDNLESAHESMVHAKAETQPAPYQCEKCGAATVYRFGRNGRFLSCSRYPDCNFASPIDREGKPIAAELTDIACPSCSGGMIKRSGRFGPFISCENYPDCDGIVNLDKQGGIKLPKPPPLAIDLLCPKCDAPLNMRRSKRGPWLSCSKFPKCRGRLAWSAIEQAKKVELEQALSNHEAENPVPRLYKVDGTLVEEGYRPEVSGQPSGDEDDPVEDAA